MATRMAVASKIRDDEITVIDDLAFEQPATKEMVSILMALGLASQSTLIATAGINQNVYKSARNIRGVSVSPVSDLNALSVLKPDRLLVTKQALENLKEQSTTKA